MKYYSTQRPIAPGTYPKAGLTGFRNYGSREYIPEINREAWGELYYGRALLEKELEDYELMKG